MSDKYEITMKTNIMDIQEDTKGACNVCSITDDDRGLNITEIKFRQMAICLCDHHKNILLQKLTSDNSDYEAAPKLPSLQEVFDIVCCGDGYGDIESIHDQHLISETLEAIKKLGNFK